MKQRMNIRPPVSPAAVSVGTFRKPAASQRAAACDTPGGNGPTGRAGHQAVDVRLLDMVERRRAAGLEEETEQRQQQAGVDASAGQHVAHGGGEGHRDGDPHLHQFQQRLHGPSSSPFPRGLNPQDTKSGKKTERTKGRTRVGHHTPGSAWFQLLVSLPALLLLRGLRVPVSASAGITTPAGCGQSRPAPRPSTGCAARASPGRNPSPDPPWAPGWSAARRPRPR